jgi:TRAP-type C4-dicarboxylate transport system substrate-binding protein
MSQKHNIKWLLYHEPIDLFLRTAEAFRDELKQLTDGRINIEIYSTEEYKNKFSDGVSYDPMALINRGDVQMSQLEVSKLGQNNAIDFFALEMPFLFRSHDHATTVLDGKIGQNMLENLSTQTAVTGLAFTYSGGYRVIASETPITKTDDLKGQTMSVGANPIFTDLGHAFGCVLKKSIGKYDDRREINKDMSTVQTTLPRYLNETVPSKHQHVLCTNHNMYLTTIIINDEFWNTLSIADQTAMRTAALNSARMERKWSVADAEKIATDSNEQAKLGIKSLTKLSPEEQSKLENTVIPVYEKYNSFFTTGLIESIKNA